MEFLNAHLTTIVLLVLLACGLLVHNPTIWVSAVLLLVLKLLPFNQPIFAYLQQYGLNAGVFVLTLAILAPIASGKIGNQAILQSFASWQSMLAIGVGLLVTWLGARGVRLMNADPNVVTSLMIGTVAGVVLFRGVAIGPLIAAGILSLLLWTKQ